jgi:hypothetical protein
MARSLLCRGLVRPRSLRAIAAALFALLSSRAAIAADEASKWRFFASVDDGMGIGRTDDAFSARIGAVVQTRYALSGTEEAGVTQNEFSVAMARPQLRATLLKPWIRLFVQPELAGTQPKLLDLEIDVQPVPEIGIKVGQMITPFSRTFLTPVPKLMWATFSPANDYFRADRDVGALLYGYPDGKGRFEYYTGVFNGNRINQKSNDNLSPEVIVRLAGTVFGAPVGTKGHQVYDEVPGLQPDRSPPTLRLGVNAAFNLVDRTKQVFDPATSTFKDVPAGEERADTVGGDVSFAAGGFVTQAEVYARRGLRTDGTRYVAVGAYAHAAYFIVPKWVEMGARVSVLDTNVDVGSVDLTAYEGQVAVYFLGHHLKTSFRYSLYDSSGVGTSYAKGTTHALLCNLQLAF